MSTKSGLPVLADSFATWTDPRIKRTRWHNLVDLVMIAVCGALCECNSWEDLPRDGRAKKQWLKGFLELPQGIPSADTFARVVQRLKPDEFLRCLSSVVAVLRRVESQEVVALDGQTLRGSGDDRTGRHPRHLVRAWATTNRRVLGQQACAEKSNEITAIPQLLKVIDIAGAIVTIDARGCQTEIADGIIERGADDVWAVKDNQPKRHAEMRKAFEQALERATSGRKPTLIEHVERQQKRGRTEERR